jgi:hypothetical protein
MHASTTPLRGALCALLMAGSAGPALATASLDGGAWALTTFVNFDRNYYYGIAVPSGGAPICTPTNCGPGHVEVPDAVYAYSVLDTAYGAMSGQVRGVPPIPDPVGPTREITANSMASGLWADMFTVTSASLPAGTPVDLLLTLRFTGTVAKGGSDSSVPRSDAGFGPGPDFPYLVLAADAQGSDQVATRVVTFAVGASFQLVGTLNLTSQGFGLQSTQTGSWQTASASAHYFVDALTPDAGYTTASGFSYAGAVPEPAPAALLLLGLAALRWRRLSLRPARVPPR